MLFTANLANHPLPPLGGEPTPEGVIHVERPRLLWEGRLYERLRLTNFAERPAVVPLGLSSRPTSATCSRCGGRGGGRAASRSRRR